MKGRITKWLRRLRSTRGFTMTETLLGVAVTGLLVMGVCAAVVNSAASTKETDVVEFFDSSNQNAIAAFRSNAKKTVLEGDALPAPFSTMTRTINGNTITFTGFYDSNLNQTTTEAQAAYKVQYTATFASKARDGFDFTESEVQLDIANYEKSKANGWVLREHNQNMGDSASSGDAVTVRVLSLNDDTTVADLDPKAPEIKPVVPVKPSDYQTVTLKADLTGQRNYWDITDSKVAFEKSGNSLTLVSTAEVVTKALAPEQDVKPKTADLGSVNSLKTSVGTTPTHIVVELHYDYVNLNKFLTGNSGYSLVSTSAITGTAASHFTGTGASFTWKNGEEDALTSLKTILGITGNPNVDLQLKLVPKEVSISNGDVKSGPSGTYAMSLFLPNNVSMEGPYTIAFKENVKMNDKLYYKLYIYNKYGQNIISDLEDRWGSEYVTDYIYFGYGLESMSSVDLIIYQNQRSEDILYGAKGPVSSWSVMASDRWQSAYRESTPSVQLKKYQDMTQTTTENGKVASDIVINSVTVASVTTSQYPSGKGNTYLKNHRGIDVGAALFFSENGRDYGWWPGDEPQSYYGKNVVKNSGLTWYVTQGSEPKDRGDWSSQKPSNNSSATQKIDAYLPKYFEFKKK